MSAQDTEAIRAALGFGRARAIATVIADNPPAHTLADEVAVAKAQFDDALAALARLVARLEAAERHERALRAIDAICTPVKHVPFIDRVAEIRRTTRAALAAAAPGETEQTP